MIIYHLYMDLSGFWGLYVSHSAMRVGGLVHKKPKQLRPPRRPRKKLPLLRYCAQAVFQPCSGMEGFGKPGVEELEGAGRRISLSGRICDSDAILIHLAYGYGMAILEISCVMGVERTKLSRFVNRDCNG